MITASLRRACAVLTAAALAVTGAVTLGHDAQAADTTVIPAANPTAAASADISNILLGAGRTELERNLVWYSATGQDRTAQLVRTADLVDGAFPTTGATSFAPTASGLSLDSAKTYHQVALTGLQPDTEYSYRVGSDAGWSAVQSFRTAPAGDYEFILVGDPQIGASGNNDNDAAGWRSSMTIAQEMFPSAELLVSAGDQVNTSSSEAQYAGLLSADQIRGLAFSPTIGNHDVGAIATYEQHYLLPNKDARTRNTWFRWNGDLYMIINSNLRDTAAHKAWLQETIAGAGDVQRKVVVMHHSIYSTASHTNDSDILQRRAEFPKVFTQLGIDIVLAGHDHVYTRTHVMRNGEPVTDGQPAVVAPKQGEYMYVTANSSSGSKFYGIVNQAFPFMSVMNQERIPNFTHVAASQCELKLTTYRSGDRSVVDEFTMKENRAVPTVEVPDVTLDAGAVAGWDALADVKVTDPCEPGLRAEVVSGQVREAAGVYGITYRVTDAYGNVVTKVRTITVTAAPQPTPTVTVTATAEPSATPTVTVTAQPSATPTATVTAEPTATATVTVTASPSGIGSPTVPSTLRAPYEVPGLHAIGGRRWFTACEPYSQTIRCRTEIWSKQVVLQGGKYVIKEGWFFNNLTYLPFMTRAQWGSNPLAKTGQWTNLGRKYKTECDTAVTGKGACRSFIWATKVQATPTAPGKYTYKLVNGWVFNNLVRLKG